MKVHDIFQIMFMLGYGHIPDKYICSHTSVNSNIMVSIFLEIGIIQLTVLNL